MKDNIINSFYAKLERNSYSIPLFLILSILDVFINFPLSFIFGYFNSDLLISFDAETPLGEIFFYSVLIGPLFETFVFQYLIINVLLFFKFKYVLILLISSVCFALDHSYNLVYVAFAFISGLFYASYYMYLKSINYKKAFLNVWCIHLLYNLLVFILSDLLKF